MIRLYALEREPLIDLENPVGAHVLKYAAVRTACVIMPWRCTGCAGMWTDRGSYGANKCTRCGTPRPPTQ